MCFLIEMAVDDGMEKMLPSSHVRLTYAATQLAWIMSAVVRDYMEGQRYGSYELEVPKMVGLRRIFPDGNIPSGYEIDPGPKQIIDALHSPDGIRSSMCSQVPSYPATVNLEGDLDNAGLRSAKR